MSGGSHPDLELLSDLWAGALPATEADELERHLEHCSICSSRVDSLVQVHGTLRMVGTDRPTMPADVTARLTAAIREEAGLPPVSEGVDTAGSGPEDADRDSRHVARGARSGRAARAGRGRRQQSRPGRARSRFARGLAVAAGFAVLAVGGTVAYQGFLSGSADQSPTATEQRDGAERAGSEEQQTYALTDRRLDLTEQDFDGQVRQAVVPSPAAAPRSDPGTPDAPGVTGQEDPGAASNPPKADGEPDEEAGTLSQPDRCVRHALAQDAGADADRILDVNEARFDDQRAILVITPGSAKDTVHAWAVVGCPGQGSVAYDAQVPVDR